MTKLLAVDTSGEACSVALSIGGEVREQFEIVPRLHARKILPMVQTLLAEAELSPGHLDAIAFGRGPGSFTGLRICAGVVQGLAFAADVPTLPVSSLAALAQGVYRRHGYHHIVTVQDARMDELYWAVVEIQDGLATVLSDDQLTAPEALDKANGFLSVANDWVGIGDGWKFAEQLPDAVISKVQIIDEPCHIQAQDIIQLAQRDYQEGRAVSAEMALPVYLRGKTAWRKIDEQG